MNPVIRILGIYLALGLLATSSAATPKALSLRLNVEFKPQSSLLSGTARIELEDIDPSLDSLCFYLHGELLVDSIVADGAIIDFSQDRVFYSSNYSLIATRVSFANLRLDSNGLDIVYHGAFHPSGARSPSDYMRIDSDGVFLRSFGYSLWFPVFLEASAESYEVDFPEVIIRTPAEFIPVFVGERIGEEVVDGFRVSKWRAKTVDLFAAQCTAQRFLVDPFDNVILYGYADSASRAANADISLLVKTLVEKYKQVYRRDVSESQVHIVEMPKFGDISSYNVTGLNGNAWREFEKIDWAKRALAHELVHPYVEAVTSKKDSLYALAVEGFPSYFHLPILVELLGDAWYDNWMKSVAKQYLEKKQTGTDNRGRALPTERPLMQIAPEEIGEYKDVFVLADRALLFFDWLYREMGKQKFFDFTQELFKIKPLSTAGFRETILSYLPKADKNITIWLSTNEYPQSLHR